MQVVDVGRDLVTLRDVGVVLVLGAGDGIGLTDALGLLERLVGPYAGIEVGSLVLQVVHGYIEELEAGAAAEEDDLMGVRNIEKFLPECAALVHGLFPFFRTVGDGEDGNARSFEIFERRDGVVDGLLRQDAGASVEYVNFSHIKFKENVINVVTISNWKSLRI